jgi:hypothetical protein
MNMKNLITEEETNNILKMHHQAINKFYASKKKLNKGIMIEQRTFDPDKSDGEHETSSEKINKGKAKVEDALNKGKSKVKDAMSKYWQGGAENKMDNVAKKAWEAVQAYAKANNLKQKTRFSEDEKHAWKYYTIKGVDFFDDGYKITNPDKPNEQVRYSEDDDELTIENKPFVPVRDGNIGNLETNKTITPPTPTKIEPETFNPGDN